MSKIQNPVVLIYKRENSDTYAVAITSGSKDYHDAILMATMEPDMTGDDVDTWSKTGYYMAAEIESLRTKLEQAEAKHLHLQCLVDDYDWQRQRLHSAAKKIIRWNRQEAIDRTGNAEDAECYACVRELRDALAFCDSNDSPHASIRASQEYPETLPCPVILEPGFRFGKGVNTRLMLRMLQRRADYCAEIDAMTPEQRAEHDAGIAEFKEILGNDNRTAMLQTDKFVSTGLPNNDCLSTRQITTSMAKNIALKLGAELNDEEADIFADGYNAAMLQDRNDVTTGKPLTITLPDITSKAFWSGTGKNEAFHPESYKRQVKEAIERSCVIAGIGVEVK